MKHQERTCLLNLTETKLRTSTNYVNHFRELKLKNGFKIIFIQYFVPIAKIGNVKIKKCPLSLPISLKYSKQVYRSFKYFMAV